MPALAPIFCTTVLLSCALLPVLGALLQSGRPGVAEWIAANLAVVIYLPLLGLRGLIPDWISIVVANTLLAASLACYYAGCARFLGQTPHWPRLFAGCALLCLALCFWRYQSDNLALRVVAVSLFSALMCVATAVLLLRHRPVTRHRASYRLTAALALLFALSQAARGLWFLSLTPAPHDLMLANGWNVALLSIGAAIMPVLSMAGLLMVHAALLAETRMAANHDHLTAAFSRQHIEHLAQIRITQAEQSTLPLSLLIIDLDHFKRVNDTYGHAGGDAVLRAFAGVVRAHLREDDALGRIGGEEFALLLPNTDTAQALRLAERLRDMAQRQPVSGAFGCCNYSISIGAASWRPGERFEHLCMRADRALYSAKHAGRNRVLPDEDLEPGQWASERA